MNIGVDSEPEPEDLGMNTCSQVKERWRSKRLKKKWEGVEIRKDAMGAHAKEDGGGGMGWTSWSGRGLNVGSNDIVPEERLERRMREMKSWVHE